MAEDGLRMVGLVYRVRSCPMLLYAIERRGDVYFRILNRLNNLIFQVICRFRHLNSNIIKKRF